MSKALKIEIKESVPELRSLMRKSIFMIAVRIRMLLQLKKYNGMLSRRKLAAKLGVSPQSIQTWRKTYIECGLSGLINHGRKGRKFSVMNDDERNFIDQTLSDPANGIQGYKELQKIISKRFDKKVAYSTLRGYCKRNLKTKIKVARKSHVKKDENAIAEFKKKNFSNQLEKITKDVGNKYLRISIYFQDESRFGLITKNGNVLTSKSVKPICKVQEIYKSTWLYGTFSPTSGDNFILEFPVCDSTCFQVFLDQFSDRKPNELLVMVLDNASFHKAKKLIVPPNIRFIFLPPYSPELNPAEKMWQKFKRAFTNELFETIEQMRNFIFEIAKSLDSSEVMSVCACSYLEKKYWYRI